MSCFVQTLILGLAGGGVRLAGLIGVVNHFRERYKYMPLKRKAH